MPEDIIHATSDPMGYLSGRMGPVVQTLEEARTGKNNIGKSRDMGQQVKDFLGRFVAVPFSSEYNTAMGGPSGVKTSTLNTGLSMAGVSVKAQHSPAEEQAMKFLGQKSSAADKTPGQLANQHLLYDLVDRVHDGDKTALTDAAAAVTAGKLQIKDMKTIIDAQTTSRLESQMKSMPYNQVLDVWKVADNEERQKIGALMLQKAATYRKTNRPTLGPVEQAHYDKAFSDFFGDLQTLHKQLQTQPAQ